MFSPVFFAGEPQAPRPNQDDFLVFTSAAAGV
jgi:hypothetical protein